MKKLLALSALACGSTFADQPLTFSSTLSATGASTAAYTTNGVNGAIQPILNHTVSVVVTGSPSACTIRLEGSLDNSNWFDLSGSQSCTSSVMFHVYGKVEKYLRVNLLTWTGGTNAAVSYLGSN